MKPLIGRVSNKDGYNAGTKETTANTNSKKQKWSPGQSFSDLLAIATMEPKCAGTDKKGCRRK